MLRTRVLLGLIVSLAGCGELFGDLVKHPRPVVANMLYNMPSSTNLMDLPQLFPNMTKTIALTPEGVVWTYSISGQPACRFTAYVKEETAGSSVVWTDMEDVSQNGQQFVCASIKTVGEESVAATLEGRPADRARVERELTAVMVENFGSLQNTIADQMVELAPKNDDSECQSLDTTAKQRACRER
jgi:hypothetical protein